MTKLTFGVVALAGAIALVASPAAAWATPTTDSFRIASLTGDNPTSFDAAFPVDDNGLVAMSNAVVIDNGDAATAPALPFSSLSSESDSSLSGDNGTFLFTDLKTQMMYYFAHTNTGNHVSTLTGLQPINDLGADAGAVVDLSEDVNLNNDEDVNPWDYCVLLGNGYGRVALWNGCTGTITDIDIASGNVTTLTGQAMWSDYTGIAPNIDNAETDYTATQSGIAGSGFVEYYDGVLRFVFTAVDSTDFSNTDSIGVYRFFPGSAATAPELVYATPSNPDVWHFTGNVASNKWCGHAEGGFEELNTPGTDEVTWCADATFDTSSPASAPVLANTGINKGMDTLFGTLAVLLTGLGVLLVRARRHAKN